jgi:crotonobetainyl-CoA:carnitine CoA-transferase CaiB-like acyl-CoA transferase
VSQWLALMSMIRPTLGIHSHESSDAPYMLRTLTRIKSNLPWLYPCKDGWVSFSPLTDRFWRGTKRALDNPEWANDPMFDDRTSRAGNSDVIEAALIDWFSTRDRLEIFARAQAEHVPCFPVFTPAEVANNPQYRERGYFVDNDHPAAGEVRMPGAPYKFSRTPWRIVRGAPRLGQHNRQIFCERLGLAESELSALADQNLI